MITDPTVSVLIANLNGRAYLGPCLDSLLRQTYHPGLTEIIVVDNGSNDDSVAFIRANYPTVRVIEAGKNLGFAGGNNAGARLATGRYLALINNDAEAAPNWIDAMVAVAERAPDVACVAAKLLTADGSGIDYVRSALSFAGRAFQLDEGMPAGESPYEAAGEVFAPCGGAMLIRRDVFCAAGGFDEDYIAYYEDVDLGWRLWLYGYKVVFTPEAVVYHRNHQTGSQIGSERRLALAEMNALRTIIKNYDDANLSRMLPLSLVLTIKRLLERTQVDVEEYRFDFEQTTSVPFEAIPRDGLASLVAIDKVADELPLLLERRREVQARRARSDADIFGRFPLWPYNPEFAWRRYNAAQDRLVSALVGIPMTEKTQRHRLLIITHETLGERMAGPAIRAWELARALAATCDVTLAASGKPARSAPGVRVVGFDSNNAGLPELAPYLRAADAVMTLGALLERYPALHDLGKPLIVDLYDPYELEKIVLAGELPATALERIESENEYSLRLQSLVGDFYVCANERQRDLWLGVLLAAGRVNSAEFRADPSLRRLIDVAPFGIPAESPVHRCQVLKGVTPGIAATDRVLLWNGGLWDWLDPLTLVEAMPLVLAERSDVKLWFAAAQHFDSATVPAMGMAERVMGRARELGLLDRGVFFGNWVPYDQRADYLLEADLGVSTHPASVESHFASRTRVLDCFWAGLPVIVSAGDSLAELVDQEDLGVVVPPSDPQALARAILDALGDEGLRARVASKAEMLRERLSWTECVKPIARFVSQAAFAPDALEASQRAVRLRRENATAQTLTARVEALERQNTLSAAAEAKTRQELIAVSAHLEAVRRGRVMRLMRALNVLFGRE